MVINQISYKLTCNRCGNDKGPSLSMIEDDISFDNLSSSRLIQIMDNFDYIDCPICSSRGEWTVKEIYANNKPAHDIDKRVNLKVSTVKLLEEAYSKIVGKSFNPIDTFNEKLDNLDVIAVMKSQTEDLYAYLVGIDFEDRYFYGFNLHLPEIKPNKIVGMSFGQVKKFSLEETDTPRFPAKPFLSQFWGLPLELNTALEENFANYKTSVEDVEIISKLKITRGIQGDVEIYLIAKKPSESTYIGIIQYDWESPGEIEEIPLEDFSSTSFEIQPIEPINALKFIEEYEDPFI